MFSWSDIHDKWMASVWGGLLVRSTRCRPPSPDVRAIVTIHTISTSFKKRFAMGGHVEFSKNQKLCKRYVFIIEKLAEEESATES